MKGLLLIDGNSVGFAAQNSTKLHSGELETQAVFGFLRTIRSLLAIEYRGWKPVVFWDGKSWRKTVSETYKANRDDDPKKLAMRNAYKAQRPLISRGLQALGISQRFAINMEADDLIAETVEKVAGRLPIVILSGDKDLLQLVGPNVVWHDPGNAQRKGRKVGEHDFAEYTGYVDADAFVQGKAMIGDVSDNLKGVDKIGEKTAALILDHWGSVAAAIVAIRRGGDDAIPDVLKARRKPLLAFAGEKEGPTSEGVQRFIENVRLMKLNPKHRPPIEGMTKVDKPFNRGAFERFCEEMSFLSILKDVDTWAAPFILHDFNKPKEKAA